MRLQLGSEIVATTLHPIRQLMITVIISTDRIPRFAD